MTAKGLFGIICVSVFASMLMIGCASNQPTNSTFSQEEQEKFERLVNLVSKGDYLNDFLGDTDKAKDVYNEACEAGLGLACWYHAFEFEDYQRAEKVLKKDCFAESPSISSGQSCTYLGIMISQEVANVSVNETPYHTERMLYERGCELGEGFACYRLAYDFLYDEDSALAEQYADKAFNLLVGKCAAGIGFYCGEIGDMYQYSIGDWASKNGGDERMIFYYQQGCELKDGSSCLALRDLGEDNLEDSMRENAGEDSTHHHCNMCNSN